MKKTFFWFFYSLTVVVPLAFYLLAAGTGPDSYTVSVILAVSAYILICDQFILASRPVFAVKALGIKGVLTLHRTSPLLILILASAHHSLKQLNGFSETSLKAGLGTSALAISIALTVFTAFLMATTFFSRIGFLASFKRWVYGKTGLTYKKARTLHNIFAAAAGLALVHMLLASSSDFSANPAGAAWMIFWMLVSLGAYARYLLSGRGESHSGGQNVAEGS